MARIVRRDHQNSPLIRGVTLQAKLGSSIGDIPAGVGLSGRACKTCGATTLEAAHHAGSGALVQ